MEIHVYPNHITGRLRSILERVTYKDDFKLEMRDDAPGFAAGGSPTLIVEVTTLDSTGRVVRGSKFRVAHHFAVPYIWYAYTDSHVTDDVLVNWVWDCVRKVEVHEAREFFKLDGVVYQDPHRGDGFQFLYT